LAVAALADGHVSEAERLDLHLVARLLGQDPAALDGILESAAKQLSAATIVTTRDGSDSDLTGKSVCFTGQLSATLIPEEKSQILACNQWSYSFILTSLRPDFADQFGKLSAIGY
jgi:uncharacterized membrane protein YebE (DUF533 family)